MDINELQFLIDFHTSAVRIPESQEVRRTRWRAEAQERFNTIGLPRGLAPIA